MKIIDAHMHLVEVIAGIGSQGELHHTSDGKAIYATGNEFKMIPGYLGDSSVTAESLITLMEKHNVEKGVLLQGNYFGMQNLSTYEAIKKYPDKFVGAASYDIFYRNKNKIIKHLFDELGFKIIKMEISTGSGLMANHDVISLLDKKMIEVFEMANERNLVFVIDIGRPGNCCYQVSELEQIVKKYPNMKFVVCHLTAPQANDKYILQYNLKHLNYPNVYFDLAALNRNTKEAENPEAKAVEFIKDAISIVGSDHLMFGSDVPSTLCHQDYQEIIDYILKSDIEKHDLDNIFYNTANSVYFN